MYKLTIVEFRKMFRRKEFYISILALTLLSIFIVYQLSAEGSIVNIQQSDNSTIPVSELIIGMVGLFNMLGITAILVCISVWNLIGSELDQQIISTYFLNSSSRYKVLFAKVLVAFVNSIVMITTLTLVTLISCLIFSPTNIELTSSFDEAVNILTACGSFIALSFLLILFSFMLALLFGSMGIILGTIGITLLSAILNTYGVIQKWLPLTIADFNKNFQLQNLWILTAYIVCLIAFCIPLIRNKEAK